MSKTEDRMGHDPLTTNTSVVHNLSPEDCDIDILNKGRTTNDFIDDMIKHSKDSEEPFFVASLDSLYMRHLMWVTKLPRVTPFYAVKCNSTPAVLKMLRALGTGFDCASKGEIKLALSLGVTPDKIIYAHTIKPPSHIRYACAHGVNVMTFDNEDELFKISHCHAKAKLVLRIAVDDSKSLLPLNSKFGASLETVDKLLERAKELSLEVIGVSFHVGSGCLDSLAFTQAIADARHVFDTANLLGFQMNLLDIGGGFTGRDDHQVNFDELSDVINAALDKHFPADSGVKVIAEPGQYFVDSAFTLVMNVIAKTVITDDVDKHCDKKKTTPNRMMMYFVNDGAFGSLAIMNNNPKYKKLEPFLHRAVETSEQKYLSVLWGPTCNILDKIISCWLPELHIEDWLLLDNMGAYTLCMRSDFSGFERTRIYPVVTAETWHTLNLSHTYNIILS
ncbi:ornithine decarboxylase-like [Antennarius striatus]|uniref:ornithine decarboxylase-like n=1 Tax=Antennarius striatus TaxID=241820 RepID=UPI0035B4CE1A